MTTQGDLCKEILKLHAQAERNCVYCATGGPVEKNISWSMTPQGKWHLNAETRKRCTAQGTWDLIRDRRKELRDLDEQSMPNVPIRP